MLQHLGWVFHATCADALAITRTSVQVKCSDRRSFCRTRCCSGNPMPDASLAEIQEFYQTGSGRISIAVGLVAINMMLLLVFGSAVTKRLERVAAASVPARAVGHRPRNHARRPVCQFAARGRLRAAVDRIARSRRCDLRDERRGPGRGDTRWRRRNLAAADRLCGVAHMAGHGVHTVGSRACVLISFRRCTSESPIPNCRIAA